jgi:hypothetical protein
MELFPCFSILTKTSEARAIKHSSIFQRKISRSGQIYISSTDFSEVTKLVFLPLFSSQYSLKELQYHLSLSACCKVVNSHLHALPREIKDSNKKKKTL